MQMPPCSQGFPAHAPDGEYVLFSNPIGGSKLRLKIIVSTKEV
jgi:hypothetical protein